MLAVAIGELLPRVCPQASDAARAARVAVGLVLAFAGCLKMREPHQAARLLGVVFDRPLAYGQLAMRSVAFVEVLLGVSLAVDLGATTTAVLVAAFLSVATATLVVAASKGYDTDCGCFGPFEVRSFGPLQSLRNLTLLGIVGWSAVASRIEACNAPSVLHLDLSDALAGIGLAVVGIAMYALSGQIQLHIRTRRPREI